VVKIEITECPVANNQNNHQKGEIPKWTCNPWVAEPPIAYALAKTPNKLCEFLDQINVPHTN
jgi:hypothetical protein